MSAFAEFRVLMGDRGRQNYGEKVTIAQHSLLTAAAAEARGAADTLVAACLMHDVGHLLDEPDDAYGIHSHDDLGGNWVAARFGEAVTEPVRFHVEAKRFLCARQPEYHDRLSRASQYTLANQGGPMSHDEAAAFESSPYAEQTVMLRRWEDDYGKLTDATIPELEHFRPLVDRLELSDSPL